MSVFALVERLAPHIESELNLVINSKQEAESLSSKLKKIQVGLQEAERTGVTDKGVKDWLKQLEAVTYEMDDVLDEWEAANLQVEVQDTSLNWDMVRSLLCNCLCLKQMWGRHEITKKMKSLSERIDNILTDKGTYSFVPGVNVCAPEFVQEESTSLVKKNDKFYGLDDLIDSLVKKLVPEGEGSDDDTQIISIVGVGGVGKSTLARVTYNDPQIDGLFAPKGWVSVSQTFNPLAVAKAILGRFGGKTKDVDNLETAVQRIREVVKNKRFLLVLDNVWTEDANKWINLRNSLDGGKGGRIVVTTRLDNVARMMGTTQWQSLVPLSDEDCGGILNGVALEGRPRDECERLRGIGMEIAKKCNGLPLAARSVGSMLVLRSSEREWKAVLESPLWEDEDKESDLFRLLNLSYLDLSPVLKRCLLSSVIFPKGTEISLEDISVVWMAYGYLNSNGSMDEVQSKGFQYLNNLTVRSFFQRVEVNVRASLAVEINVRANLAFYKMHDIMHDFATYLSRSDDYSFIMHGPLEKENSSFLRTYCIYKKELHPNIISNLTSVRVLSLIDCNLQGIPEDIGKLIHLRYLNVSENPMTELPETITGLCNLQTLDIQSCRELSSLPEGIGKLINLRHLLNRDTDQLVELPQGVGELSGLRTLSEYKGSNFGLLRNMNQLQGRLQLMIEDFDEGEFGEPNLCQKQDIETLLLSFKGEKMVEALEPPPKLQTLFVHGNSCKWLSRWITSFHNLKLVSVSDNRFPDQPPFYKLQALEELYISVCYFGYQGCLSMGFVGVEDGNSRQVVAAGFPRLKKLTFDSSYSWYEWEDIKQESSVPVFPSLEELHISECRCLIGLPLSLLGKASSLRLVKIINCKGLYARYNEESGEDRHNIPPNQTWTIAE